MPMWDVLLMFAGIVGAGYSCLGGYLLYSWVKFKYFHK